MLDDPVIQLVRKARHAISARHGHDPFKIVQYYIQRQQTHKDRIKGEAGQVVSQPGKQS